MEQRLQIPSGKQKGRQWLVLSLVVVEQKLKMKFRLLDLDVSNDGMTSPPPTQEGVFCPSLPEFSLVPELWVVRTKLAGLEHFLPLLLEGRALTMILVLEGRLS